MNKYRRLILVFLLCSIVERAPAQDQTQAENIDEKFYVVVNEECDVDLEDKNVFHLLRRLYLKQQTFWPSGETSVFFARNEVSAEEKAFRKVVLHMTDAQLDDHWVKMKQMRGLTPPRAVNSTRILLRQMQLRRDAVGVISEHDYLKHAKDSPRIKVLAMFYASGQG